MIDGELESLALIVKISFLCGLHVKFLTLTQMSFLEP